MTSTAATSSVASPSSSSPTLLIPRAHLRKAASGSEVVFYELRSRRHIPHAPASAAATTTPGSSAVTDVAFKRFSDFVTLDTKLRKNYPEHASSFPVLPPKKLFGNLDPKFIEARRVQLESYLIALVTFGNMHSRESMIHHPVNGGNDEDSGESSVESNSSTGSSHSAAPAASPSKQHPHHNHTSSSHTLPSTSLSPLSLLHSSLDLRAFVPAGFLKEPLLDLHHFQLIEVNTWANKKMQLTVEPRVDGTMLLRGAGGGGLDSQTNRLMISVNDLLGVHEVDGNLLRVILSYSEPHSLNGANPTSSGSASRSNNPGRPGRSPSAVSSNTPLGSSASFMKQGEWSDVIDGDASSSNTMSRQSISQTHSTYQPMPSPTTTSNNSSNTTGGSSSSPNSTQSTRIKRKTFEFSTFEDRSRFCCMVRYLLALVKEGPLPTNGQNYRTSVSLNASPMSTTESSPNSLTLYPPPSSITLLPVSVFTTSWNQAKEPEPEDLSAWIPKNGGGFDIVAVGVQESPTSVSELADNIVRNLGGAYTCFCKKGLWEIKLLVFARLELLPHISKIESDSVATGIMGIMGNKGGVGISFRIYNQTTLAFINTHLAPHMERYADRNKMFQEIDQAMRLGQGMNDLDSSLRFDHLFWIGDLNYRIELPHAQITTLAAKRAFDVLVEKDQLRRAQWSQEAFTTYYEGKLAFAPTYKYVMGKSKRKGSELPGPPGVDRTNSSGSGTTGGKSTTIVHVTADSAGAGTGAIKMLPPRGATASNNSSSKEVKSEATLTTDPVPASTTQTNDTAIAGPPLPPKRRGTHSVDLSTDSEMRKQMAAISSAAANEPTVATVKEEEYPTHQIREADMSSGDEQEEEEEHSMSNSDSDEFEEESEDYDTCEEDDGNESGNGSEEEAIAKLHRGSVRTHPVMNGLATMTLDQIMSNGDGITLPHKHSVAHAHTEHKHSVAHTHSHIHAAASASSEVTSVSTPTATPASSSLPLNGILRSSVARSGGSVDTAEKELFNSLDPDFASYSRKRVLANALDESVVTNELPPIRPRKQSVCIDPKEKHRPTTVQPSAAAATTSTTSAAVTSASHVPSTSNQPVSSPVAAAATASSTPDNTAASASSGDSIPKPTTPQRGDSDGVVTTSGSSASNTTASTISDPISASSSSTTIPASHRNSVTTPTNASASTSTSAAIPAPSSTNNVNFAPSTLDTKAGDSSSTSASAATPTSKSLELKRQDSSLRRRSTVPYRRKFNRQYGKKRIPSWCDRILFRSHRMSDIKLHSYYRCDHMTTSDHIPVCATFLLQIPIAPPFLAYSFPASLVFSHLTIELTVHPTRLGQTSLRFLEKIYVTFLGPVLDESARGKRTGFATLKIPHPSTLAGATDSLGGEPLSPLTTTDLHPLVVIAHWTELDLPVLKCVLGSPEYLAYERVYFIVKSGDELGGGTDLVLGQGQISMEKVASGGGISAQLDSSDPTTIMAGVRQKNPFPPALEDGHDGSVGATAIVRSPPSATSVIPYHPLEETPRKWNFCASIERHSASIGTLNGNVFVSIEKPENEEVQVKTDEALIQEALECE